MQTLQNCPRCDGFVPSSSSSCPHCEAPFSPSSQGLLSRVGQKLLGIAGSGALAMTLMACYGAPPQGVVEPTPSDPNACSAENDKDQDGFCAPQDCDDTNGLFFPGAQDTSSDGVDQDCDGVDGS